MKILLTGGSGQVGTELRALEWPEGVSLVAPPRSVLNLSVPRSIQTCLADETPDAILSCGAYTAVDRAESDVAAAWAVNALGPAVLAAYAGAADVPIVHVSTDYVFDGAKNVPYVEDDPISPRNVYGASKAGGEHAVRTAAPRSAIVRASWVVSPRGSNFVKTMVRLARERPTLRVVDDQWGAPTGAADLAAALRTVVLRMAAERHAPTGVFHFCNAGETTWRRVAEAIFDELAKADGPRPTVEPIATADYPTLARRPPNSRLDTSKIRRDFGISSRPWEVAVRDAMAPLIEASDGSPAD